MTSVEQFVHEIENYLKNDQAKLNDFHKIMSEINEGMNQDQIYDRLIELIQDNEQLLEMLTQGVENVGSDIDAFPELVSFVQTIDVHANNQSNIELFTQFSHVISLFTNELVTIQFFEERIKELTNKLQTKSRRPIEQNLSKLILKIRTSDEQEFFKTIRQNYLKEIDDEYIINPEYTPSVLAQILVMTGCVCNKDQINTVLHALKLYSSDLIPIDGVYRWIEPINHSIAQTFEEASQTESIESFYPPSIFEIMKKEIKPNQLKWALGENLYTVLNDNEKANDKPLSFLNLALKYKKEYVKQKDRNEAATMPYIAELQSIKMFKILTIMADFYRSDNFSQHPKIPAYLLDLIFGPGQFEHGRAYYAFLIQKCLSFGAEANMIESHFMEQRLSDYIPSSNDWRVAFHEKLQKRYLVHTLFFTGKVFEIKDDEEEAENIDVLKETSSIVKNFSAKFTKLNSNEINVFLKMFEGGDFDLIEEAALAVACFMEMLEMVDDVRYSPQDNLSSSLPEIPRIVWEENSPLILFDGFSIANIDIALKYFVRHLHKAYEKYPQQFERKKYSFPPAGIAYHFSVKDSKYSIKGYINPAFD